MNNLALSLPAPTYERRLAVKGRHSGKDIVVIAVIFIFRIAQGGVTVERRTFSRIVIEKLQQLFAPFDRRRAQEQFVDETEDRRVGAYAQSHRQHHDRGPAGSLQ